MAKGTLMLHCGAEPVDVEQLAKVHTPSPTRSHFPVPHMAVVDQVTRAFDSQNIEIQDAQHGLTHDGSRYFGLMQIQPRNTELTTIPDDWAMTVGIRNSHDKSFSAGLVAGSRVFVCDNLCFSGEVALARKHTRRIYTDLPRLVADTVSKVMTLAIGQQARIDGYKSAELSQLEAHDLIIRLLQAKAIASSYIGKIVDEYNAPSHPEFSDRTMWSLMNAVTEVSKGRCQPGVLVARTQHMQGVFDSHLGLNAPQQTTITTDNVISA